jgi:peptidoglycan hydrolase FlgJ
MNMQKPQTFALPLYGGEAESALPPKTAAQSKMSYPADAAAQRKQLIEAGRQFEAYFISYLMKVMRETVPDGAVANKHGAYFHSFYDQEIGLRAAEAGGIGITRMVEEHAEKYFVPPPAQPSSPVR